MNFMLIIGRGLAESVSRRSVAAKGQVRSHVSPCKTCGEVALRQVLLPVLRFLLVSVIPPFLHIHPHLCVAFTWGLSKNNALSEI
jgi:hypothetical protein